MKRIPFIKRSWAEGWRALVQVANHYGALALLAALFGAPLVVSLLDISGRWFYFPLVSFVVLTLLFGEGAFRLWRSQVREATFPSLAMRVEPMFAIPLETETRSESRLLPTALVFSARVTNREAASRVNLTFDMGVRWQFADRTFHTRLYPTREETNRAYEKKVFPSILELDPGTTQDGFLSFNHDSLDSRESDRTIEYTTHEDRPLMFKPRRDNQFFLTVHDYASLQSVEMPVPANWPDEEPTQRDTT